MTAAAEPDIVGYVLVVGWLGVGAAISLGAIVWYVSGRKFPDNLPIVAIIMLWPLMLMVGAGFGIAFWIKRMHDRNAHRIEAKTRVADEVESWLVATPEGENPELADFDRRLEMARRRV